METDYPGGVICIRPDMQKNALESIIIVEPDLYGQAIGAGALPKR